GCRLSHVLQRCQQQCVRYLPEHQEREYHDLYGAGEHGRRSAIRGAEKLRERPEQVLHADFVGRDRDHLRPDRLGTRQYSHLEIIPSETKRPGEDRALCILEVRTDYCLTLVKAASIGL